MSKYDEVLKPFLQLMDRELRANAGKGDRPGWLSMSTDTCLLEIIYHFGKLQASVKRGDIDGITEYAADVANMSMMLVDICGALPDQRHETPEIDLLNAENEALRVALESCADELEGQVIQCYHGQPVDDMHPVTRRSYERDMACVTEARAAMSREVGHE